MLVHQSVNHGQGNQTSGFANCLASGHSFRINEDSRLSNRWARSPFLSSDQISHRKSSFAGCLATQLVPGPQWTSYRDSCFANALARLPVPARSRLWSNLPPKVRLQTSWQDHSFQTLIKIFPKGQTFQTAWPRHFIQELVKVLTKSQALQTAWQCHSVQTLVELGTESQALQTAWPTHSFHPLVKHPAERQALQLPRQRYCS